MFFENKKAALASQVCAASPENTEPTPALYGVDSSSASLPQGLLGELAHFIRGASPHPNTTISLAASIALMSGICGKAYNTYTGAGLNQYILLLASTGMGKEAAASGISRLLASAAKTVPAAIEFKGPALVSSAGLLKWLVKKPSIVCVAGEFGYKLKALTSQRINPNDEMLKATLLDLYGKSGAGQSVDTGSYSDPDKQTPAVAAPAVTLLGESVPGVVYEALGESMVLSGLLPRFMVIEVRGQRSELQESPKIEPNADLTQRLANLCSHSLSLNHNNQVHVVAADAEAKAKFREFGQWVTNTINAHTSEVHRELWNRAHLKALKLASLCAVGINPHAPIITMVEAMWATHMIVDQTQHLLAKFDSGDVGEVAGDEGKQQKELMRVIWKYVHGRYAQYERYSVDPEMHAKGVITLTLISQRCRNIAAFKNDKAGATKAIDRTLKSLTDGDQLRQVGIPQMLEMFGKKPRAYVVSDPQSFRTIDLSA